MGPLPLRSVSRIAIIGAGPSGITAGKYLLAERAFEQIDIFEQRREVGGVWNLTANSMSSQTPIPQLNPNCHLERQLLPKSLRTESEASSSSDTADRFETPLYDLLETNIPKQLMQYAGKPFAEDLPLFPQHESVLQYCMDYAECVRSLIRFNCQVLEVRPTKEDVRPNDIGPRWSLTTIDEATQTRTLGIYDAIVLASGHYSVPHIPAIKGIETWSSSYPGSIMHSKAYRSPATFTGKKVIVIGNSASGVDISAQIGKFCKHPLLQSSRTENPLFPSDHVLWKEDVPEIVQFLDPKEHSRSLQLADGRIERDVDVVLFATGYFYSFPFLKVEPPVITNGLRTRDVYQQLFHIKHPTLAFLALPQKVIPFPMAENQAAVVARVWSGRLALPSEVEMRAWENARLEKCGSGKAMHVLNYPEDANYLNMLYDWAASATPCSRVENEGSDSLGTRWNEKQEWIRSQFPAIKKAYVERGENRYSVKTLEELGFDFENWRREQGVDKQFPT